MSDETRHTLQQLLRLALEAVLPLPTSLPTLPREWLTIGCADNTDIIHLCQDIITDKTFTVYSISLVDQSYLPDMLRAFLWRAYLLY